LGVKNMKNKKAELCDDDDSRAYTNDLVSVASIEKKEIIVNLDSIIADAYYYREIFLHLRDSDDDNVIRLIINTDGGYLDTVIQFYYYILNTKAKVIAEVHKAASAGVDIALLCDEIIVHPLSKMMIHTMSYGIYGKSNDIDSTTLFVTQYNKKVFDIIYNSFLTPSEINHVLSGSEMWLNETDIKARLKNWIPLKKRIEKDKPKKKK
jgi:ATP-dependent protease ClpP protease subunit